MRGFITDRSAPRGLRLADNLPEPEPAPDELVIGVRAAGVNRGELALLGQRDQDWRPGQDVAGTVHRAAADGSGPPEGAPVIAIVDGAGWSQRVAVPTQRAAALPPDVSFTDAAALPIAGLTALRGLRRGGSVLARRVLVTAASGAVGQFATQLARAAGAEVIALVSRPESALEARDAGAHDAVTSLDGASRFHLVLDGAGGPVLKAALAHLAPTGLAVTYGGMAGAADFGLGNFLGHTLVGLVHSDPENERGADLAVLAGLVADGRLRPRIGRTENWEKLREVLDDLAGGRFRGKAVLTLAQS
ncbi:zinc-binding dehydrogenase [Pseudonocardia nantongensis]|uniref:zinc-binding dehydrogenase n=1 Tax=Pseudonocardia nantongensis TaxID=1181885 RepID=UPI00397C465E